MEEEKQPVEKLKEQVEKQIESISENGLDMSNIDVLYKLVDIHKDLANEKYWKAKEENYMAYSGYGRRGVPGTGRGYRGYGAGYSEGGYGRRGVKGTGRGRYRGGDEAMDEMQEHYENFSEASAEMYNGNYGAEGEMVQSVEGIMENVYKIIEELSEAESPEVMQIIQKYAHKIKELQ